MSIGCCARVLLFAGLPFGGACSSSQPDGGTPSAKETALASRPFPTPPAGDILKIFPTADSDREYGAKVLRVSPTIDAASGSYDVTAQLAGGKLELLRPGMAVKVLWPLWRSKP